MPGQACLYGGMANSKSPRWPCDPDKLSNLLSGGADGRKTESVYTEDGRDLAAVLLGRRGGLKGGHARAAALTPEQRREIAVKAARARWSRKNNE